MPVTDSVIPMASQALEPGSVIPMASQLELASVPAWVPESASGRESVWVRESGLPTVPVWVPESALGLAPGLELDLAPDSVIPVLLARESASVWVPVPASDSGLEPESLAWASESVPGLEPEMLTGSDSVMPMASQALESVSVIPMASPTGSALASESLAWASESVPAWVPESVWARESASELGEDRNQRHLQPLSLPLLRLLPRIYPGK